MVGILVMVHSFRKTVEHWIQETIRADLVVVPAAWEMQGSEASLPEERIEELARLPGVLAADGYREIRINLGEEPVLLVARDLTIHNRFSQYLFLKGDSHQILEAASRGEGLLISEPLSLRFRLHRGDTLPLETPNGHLALPILGIFHDYSTDGGRLLMDRKLYRHYWPHDNRISVVALYLAPDTTPEETREALLQHPLGNQMATINHRDLKEGILNIFDQTFAITYALELIAMVVGVLGIFNTLLTSILERKRELGILRAIGMSRLQLVIMILYEGGFIGIIGCLLGGSAGMGLSWLLIAVINKQAFGWTIHFEPFPDLLGIICLLVLIIAILASLIPARRAMALQIAEAVHYE
jgi:putative ABC transport system permease protein